MTIKICRASNLFIQHNDLREARRLITSSKDFKPEERSKKVKSKEMHPFVLLFLRMLVFIKNLLISFWTLLQAIIYFRNFLMSFFLVSRLTSFTRSLFVAILHIAKLLLPVLHNILSRYSPNILTILHIGSILGMCSQYWTNTLFTQIYNIIRQCLPKIGSISVFCIYFQYNQANIANIGPFLNIVFQSWPNKVLMYFK